MNLEAKRNTLSVAQIGTFPLAGRYASLIRGQLDFIVYIQLALDEAYRSNNQYTNTTLNLLDTVHSVLQALQMFQPMDENSNVLVMEPMRLANDSKPIRYGKSKEWVFGISTFELSYLSSLNTFNSTFV